MIARTNSCCIREGTVGYGPYSTREKKEIGQEVDETKQAEPGGGSMFVYPDETIWFLYTTRGMKGVGPIQSDRTLTLALNPLLAVVLFVCLFVCTNL